jgi:N-dimethylarginine dimethylaminohydrolase
MLPTGLPALPATYGGPGAIHRAQTHEEDVQRGVIWATVGQRDEWGRLRRCALPEAPASLDAVIDPEAAWMLRRPDRAQIQRELDALAALFDRLGVEVWTVPAARAALGGAPPNLLFLRDLGLTTPAGVLLGRPAAPIRAGEVAFFAAALAERGAPILGLPTAGATVEGADALWLDAETVAVGVGNRTNAAGLAWLQAALAAQGVAVLPVAAPARAQHLLGVCLRVDRDLALIDQERCPAALRAALSDRGVALIELAPSAELREGRANNAVVVGPRALVMPAGNPGVQRQLERAGITVWTAEMGGCLAAAGAMACMTATLLREPG